MKKETLKKIFNFLKKEENKEHKDNGSIKWKLFFNEPFTKGRIKCGG